MWTKEVWHLLESVPLNHWVAFPLDGTRILASGESLRVVCEEAKRIYGDEFMVSKNPRILSKSHCFTTVMITLEEYQSLKACDELVQHPEVLEKTMAALHSKGPMVSLEDAFDK